jgi:hypothetical protein
MQDVLYLRFRVYAQAVRSCLSGVVVGVEDDRQSKTYQTSS